MKAPKSLADMKPEDFPKDCSRLIPPTEPSPDGLSEWERSHAAMSPEEKDARAKAQEGQQDAHLASMAEHDEHDRKRRAHRDLQEAEVEKAVPLIDEADRLHRDGKFEEAALKYEEALPFFTKHEHPASESVAMTARVLRHMHESMQGREE